MTKNNLAVHLKWLLNQGTSLHPSLSTESPPIQRERVSQQPPLSSDESELLDAIIQDSENTENVLNEDMAKLQTSLSARNPRLFSRSETWKDEPPSTLKKASTFVPGRRQYNKMETAWTL